MGCTGTKTNNEKRTNRNFNSQNKSMGKIKQNNDNKNTVSKINISEIETTIVNSKIKSIIEVHRNYRKYKEIFSNKSMEEFIKSQIKKYPSLTSEEIEKCAKNKNFNFSLMINGGKIFEIIISSYKEFKMWINGLSFLIKNKKQFIRHSNESRNSKF